jgi:phosphate starvation-inducible PhoH-like protein
MTRQKQRPSVSKAQHIQPKNENQDRLLRAVAGPDQLVITTGPAGVGKAQPLDAKVLLDNYRWTTMGQLKVGDWIATVDGGRQRVTGVFEQGPRQVYRVKFEDGRSTEACAEHLWQTNKGVVPTSELLGLSIPVWKGVPRLYDPRAYYSAVAWMRSTPWMGCPPKIDEDYSWSALIAMFDSLVRFRKDYRRGTVARARFNGDTVHGRVLAELVRRHGGICAINSHSRPRLEKIHEAFSRPIRPYKDRQLKLKAVEIRPTRVVPTRCISVDSPDRLYITDDYIVTHNTYCAVNQGVNEIYQGHYRSMVLTRPSVPTGRSLGFFPGTIEEKLEPWLAPALSVLKERMTAGEYETARKWLQLQPIETVRGSSFRRSLIFVDEAQNLQWEELKALVTRIGEGSKMVLMGDPTQRDVKSSALDQFTELVYRHQLPVPVIQFGVKDIVRSDIVGQLVRVFMEEKC